MTVRRGGFRILRYESNKTYTAIIYCIYNNNLSLKKNGIHTLHLIRPPMLLSKVRTIKMGCLEIIAFKFDVQYCNVNCTTLTFKMKCGGEGYCRWRKREWKREWKRRRGGAKIIQQMHTANQALCYIH